MIKYYSVETIMRECKKRGVPHVAMEISKLPVDYEIKKCCGNCSWFDGDETDDKPQFCDEHEIFTLASGRCHQWVKKGKADE